jgi:hypothetical protein
MGFGCIIVYTSNINILLARESEAYGNEDSNNAGGRAGSTG